MIRIARVEGQAIIKLAEKILPNFVFEDAEDRAEMGREIGQLLATSPESLMFVVAWRDEEPIGAIVAVAQGKSVFVSQFWSAPGNPWSVANALFNRVLLWAAVSGKASLKARTTRNLDAVLRRFGFVEVSQNVEHKIPTDLLPALLTRAGTVAKEAING